MARDGARRTALTEAATDYVLEHGLIGLSLRPLAAEVGTSDRMLLYHFASKDDLVASVLRCSNDRSIRSVRALPSSPDVRTAVTDLWTATSHGQLARCQRLYVEAAALGLLGQEPYATVVREANESWLAALADHLVGAGCDPGRSRRVVALLDATFMGLELDLPLRRDSPELVQAVADLATAVAATASNPAP